MLGDEGQGFTEGVVVLLQATTQFVQSGHSGFPLANAAFCSAEASFWYLAFQSA